MNVEIVLPTQLALALIVVWAYLALRGRVEILAGMYCSAMYWVLSIFIISVFILWVLLPLLLASALVYAYQQRLWRNKLRTSTVQILVWITLWAGWILTLYLLFPPQTERIIMRNIFVYGLLSAAVVSLFATDVNRVRNFAWTFVATTTVGGVITVFSLPLPVLYYFQSTQWGVLRLWGVTGVDPLTLAIPLAISLLYLFSIIQEIRCWLIRVLLGGVAAFLAFCLLLTGSRQSMIGVAVAGVLFIFWLFKQRGSSRLAILSLLVLLAGVAILIYSNTSLFQRWTLEEIETSGDWQARIEIWQHSWDLFLQSPIWGNGLDYFGGYFAHNLFLDVLAAQGLIGFIFLAGSFALVLRYGSGSWKGIGTREQKLWRMTILSVLVYQFFSLSVSGGLSGASHLFWNSAFLWRLGSVAQASESRKRVVAKAIPSSLPPTTTGSTTKVMPHEATQV